VRHTEKPVRVLEITGLGRSRSTILDIVLGNHPQIESVREVGKPNPHRLDQPIEGADAPTSAEGHTDEKLTPGREPTKSSCSASTGSLATESGRYSLKRLKQRCKPTRRGGEERAQR
jgi:hypothetical protein